MSFTRLNKDELVEVAKFFVVDVEPADEEKGPTKKELLAALSAGDEPVTWDDYNNIYLAAKKEGQDKAKGPDLADATEPTPTEPAEYDGPTALVKLTSQNRRLDKFGYTFTQSHPFHKVPEEVAELMVRSGDFRLALPSEVADFYN